MTTIVNTDSPLFIASLDYASNVVLIKPNDPKNSHGFQSISKIAMTPDDLRRNSKLFTNAQYHEGDEKSFWCGFVDASTRYEWESKPIRDLS